MTITMQGFTLAAISDARNSNFEVILKFAGGIPIFLIFDTKHRLWVLEMPSQGGSNMYPQPMF